METGSERDLDEAIDAYRAASRNTPQGNPARPGYLKHLAEVLTVRGGPTDSMEDLTEAVEALTEAADASADTADGSHDLERAGPWTHSAMPWGTGSAGRRIQPTWTGPSARTGTHSKRHRPIIRYGHRSSRPWAGRWGPGSA